MHLVNSFRDPIVSAALISEVEHLVGGLRLRIGSEPNQMPTLPVTFMEVCGTHTMAISRFGIRNRVPKAVHLVSGPGCPVCVTPTSFIREACAMAELPDVAIATFGDLMRVPAGDTSLELVRARGKDVRVVYSPLEVLQMAEAEPTKAFVFLAVGFETTAPAVAWLVTQAEARRLTNVYLLCGHKTMPAALACLAGEKSLGPDSRRPLRGFICPGHVSTIIGTKPYETIAEEYGVSCVVAGFEPLDILLALCLLLRQVAEGRFEVENAYTRAVRRDGNPAARRLMYRVFEPCDAEWRGLGCIPESGLQLRDEFAHRDARLVFPIVLAPSGDDPRCRCGDVLRGVIEPTECDLFANACTPLQPRGACMVSSEGTCAAYYRYELSKHDMRA